MPFPTSVCAVANALFAIKIEDADGVTVKRPQRCDAGKFDGAAMLGRRRQTSRPP
jgi:hypothetical protein